MLPESVRDQFRSIMQRRKNVEKAILFGSRAKGIHKPSSDIDIVLVGEITDMDAEAIAMELNDIPTPYIFEVQSLSTIQHEPLLEHIQRVGVVVYERNDSNLVKGATT